MNAVKWLGYNQRCNEKLFKYFLRIRQRKICPWWHMVGRGV